MSLTKLCLANIDYRLHTSDEGWQLQDGLRVAGWDCRYGPANVSELLDAHRPDVVFVQDVRDWLSESDISFRKDIDFAHLEAIGEAGLPAFTVLKDAWGWHDIQAACARHIGASYRGGILTYYRHDMIHDVAPWTRDYPLHRVHHTVDGDLIMNAVANGEWQFSTHRGRGLVTGNVSPVYPLRSKAVRHADQLGLHVRTHPGYTNLRCDTPAYLLELMKYKVHVATASQWGCAFRKIIESVACGCTPVTNLPAEDVLPEIDGALVRIPTDIDVASLKQTIDEAEASWDFEQRLAWAQIALRYYDWREAGKRLDALMTAAVRGAVA